VPAPLKTQAIVTYGIHTAVKAAQPTALHPIAHTTVAHTERGELGAGDKPPLPRGKVCQTGLGAFPRHMPR
jgi:hypothetical protein